MQVISGKLQLFPRKKKDFTSFQIRQAEFKPMYHVEAAGGNLSWGEISMTMKQKKKAAKVEGHDRG